MQETGTDQFPHGSLRSVLGVRASGVSAEDKDQLVHREPDRVFTEEKGQDGTLGPVVFACRGSGVARRTTRRVLVSHEELCLLVVRRPVALPRGGSPLFSESRK
jgi:hypothetical protein